MKQRNDSGGENHRSDEDPNSPSSSSSEIEDSQSQVLPLRKLLIVFPALALVQFTSFLDQTAVSTAQPAISKGLHIGSSISWIGSSFLIASTSIQLINGRLSDIFGRKACLIVSLTVMGIGNLLSGFSWAPGWLYATRAVSGLGAGAINGLVQIAISDITSLKQRGNYFGIIGIAVALGNGLGPVIGGTLTQKTSWRWSLWFVSPLTAVAIVILIATLPPTRVSGNTLHKVKSVDWTGVLLNVMAVTLLLIPISQGGSNISWSSPSIVIMLCIGGALCFVFLVWEGRFAKVPIMPIRLLKNGYSANILLIQNLAIGWVYWGNLYYIPVYFQTIRGYDPSMSGVLLLPMVIAHGIFSGSSGFLVSYTGGYYWILLLGSAVWTIGASLKAKFYEQTTSVWMFIVFGILEGFGVGFCFQPVLVALLASSAKADRAVMTGLRNFLRAMGGAVGLTVSGAILSNILERKLKGKFSTKVIAQLTSSVTDLSSLGISEADQSTILQAYMQGLNAVFISYACLVGLCFLSFTIIKDYGVGGRDDAPKDKDANESATASQIAGIASPSTSKKAEV